MSYTNKRQQFQHSRVSSTTHGNDCNFPVFFTSRLCPVLYMACAVKKIVTERLCLLGNFVHHPDCTCGVAWEEPHGKGVKLLRACSRGFSLGNLCYREFSRFCRVFLAHSSFAVSSNYMESASERPPIIARS